MTGKKKGDRERRAKPVAQGRKVNSNHYALSVHGFLNFRAILLVS